jgi:putative transposase
LTSIDSAIIQVGVARAEQQELRFPSTWGGRRAGAGRPKGSRRSTRITHVRRPRVSPHKPHHVTVRVTRGTWNLRSQRCFAPVRDALERAKKRAGFRVVHFSVQHNHMHLIVEADDRRTMSGGLRALFARVARELNRVMHARGARFDDRYHEHILATPTETKNALYYVLGNRAAHLARWGHSAQRDATDPFSSAAEPIVKRPRSWLLREGWTRAGP